MSTCCCSFMLIYFYHFFLKEKKNDINFSFQQCPQAAHTFSATFELAGKKNSRKEEIKIAIRFFSCVCQNGYWMFGSLSLNHTEWFTGESAEDEINENMSLYMYTCSASLDTNLGKSLVIKRWKLLGNDLLKCLTFQYSLQMSRSYKVEDG